MNFTLRLGPGKTEFIERTGDFFAVVFSPIDVFIRLPGEEEVIYSQGDSLTLGNGEQYKYLQVRNPTVNTVDVVIYAGTGRYEQRRQAVIEPPRRVTAKNGILPINTDIGSVIDLSPVPSTGDIRRKEITITNRDPNNELELWDMNDQIFQVIFPKSSVILPISEGLKLKNPNAAPVSYCLGEIYWMT